MMPVAVLFARSDSIYKQLPGCDVWDADRDATRWDGGSPVIAHPPCRLWGRLAYFAKSSDPEKERDLARFAVTCVQRFGGVLEHPKGSRLWQDQSLPFPGQRDEYGGWTLPVLQFWWGHRAEKATWLYIVGVDPNKLPAIPLVLGDAPCVVQTRKRINARPHLHKKEREQTPIAFAEWLLETARQIVRSA